MTREVTLQDRARHIFKTWLTPLMVEKGFKKTGRIYSRQVGRMVHVADLQQSWANRKDSISFTLNCGVHIPRVWSHFTKGPEPTKLQGARGVIHVRPGLVCVPKRHSWWDMKSSDDPAGDEAFGQDFRAVVEEGAFRRFFDLFPTEADVANFLMEPRTKQNMQIWPPTASMGFVYAGIIWDQLSEYDKCRTAMARAAELAHGKRLEADCEKFAREYVCGQFPHIEPTHSNKPAFINMT